MKMNQKRYIKMVIGAKEIQKHWKPLKGDWALIKKDQSVITDSSIVLISEPEQINKKEYIWLPLLHQLLKLGVTYGYFNWMEFDKASTRFWDYLINIYKDEHPSKEMCGLSLVMHAGHHKNWDGHTWIKQV